MKSNIFGFFVAFITGVACASAQDSSSSGKSMDLGDIHFGAKAGLNISTFVGDDFSDISPNLGAYIGGMAEIPAFFDNFYLQPELLVSFQGPDIGPENLNLTYIHLPIMAKYHITDAFAAEFGPQLGFLVADNSEDIDGLQDTNTFQVALNAGGGYRLNENFYFQARYGLGLTKVLDGTKLKNGVFSVGACYFF